MLVDDEELNHKVIGEVLRHAGYKFVGTQNPKEAVALLRREEPQLVILDVDMPELDGLSVLEELRNVSEVPVIMLTGVDRASVAVRAIRIGAFDYLTKPVDFKKLLGTISSALAMSSVQSTDQIGKYMLETQIGKGGMGTVYRAFDPRLERKVAVKVLVPELAADPRYELMFLREARAAAKLSHPGLVAIYEADRHRGRLYMAMELVEGTTLHHLLYTGHEFTPKEAVGIAGQAAEALQVAHTANLIHRDIKPVNIMLTEEMKVKILDFGLVRVVRPISTGETDHGFVGTPSHASPEQIQSHAVDARADIYSLGVILHEMLAGPPAFEGDSPIVVMAKVLQGHVKRPLSEVRGVPRKLARLATKMMDLEPKNRPASMTEVIAALKQI